MFFIGIFGIENKNKEIKTLTNIYCKHCGFGVNGKLIKNFYVFHIFFIPLIKWNAIYYVVCDRCDSIYEISKEDGIALENGENIELKSENMKEISSSYNNSSPDLNEENTYTSHEDRKCPICGFNVDASFKYCPKCGQRVR